MTDMSLLFIKTTVRGWICSSAEENKIKAETCWEAATGEIKWKREY
jgi:hypothetical protein